MNVPTHTLLKYLKNKSVSLLVFALLVTGYIHLPDSTPFVEVIYTAITAYGVVLLGPIIRMQIFMEAANYAETGGLDADLNSNAITAKTKHYWFATAISYLVPLACMCTIAK